VENAIDEIFFCILMSFIENFYCKNFDGSHYGFGRNKIQVFYGRDHSYFSFFKILPVTPLKDLDESIYCEYKIKKIEKINLSF
jgi:hypothetical protein